MRFIRPMILLLILGDSYIYDRLIVDNKIQSNLDYSKCQGPQESFRIIGSSNDRKREFSDIFGKARTFHRTSLF